MGAAKIWAAAILALLLLSAVQAQTGGSRRAGEPVRYRLTPVMQGTALSHMDVELRFRGEADGKTRLVLPERWAGSTGLRAHLSDFRVEGAAATDEAGQHMMLSHRPNAKIRVRYRVDSGHATDPDRKYEKARPVIRPDWFLLMGEGVFGYPQGSDNLPARFSWGRFPNGWKAASDLDHLARERPGTVSDVVESVSMGSRDLVVVERPLGGKRVRIAARGSWPFEVDEFATRMTAIIEKQNRYWQDPGRPFLVVLAPLAGGTATETFSHGTGRTDAFAFASSTNQQFKDIVRVLSHESMHSWVGREVGGPLPKDEALGYWLSEGFTDYLAARLLLRGGDWSLEDYVAELNKVLRRNALSPARAATNREILEKFWRDSAYGQLPYDRGHLLALLIDYRLRRHTEGAKTFDDIMLAQKLRAQAEKSTGAPTPAPLLFPIVVREQTGLDLSDFLARHVEAGEPFELPQDLFGDCAQLEMRREGIFEYGFDQPATRAADNVVQGLDPASPAHAAGLRNGMKLLRIERASRETGEIVFIVGGATERPIRYFRTKKGENLYRQVVLSPVATGEARERCRMRMSGA